MKRKVFSALLALCVLISTVGWSALPAQAENNETGGATHKHEKELSQRLSSISSGQYYLNEDWLLTAHKTISVTRDATICLNSHKIDVNGKSLQIIVASGAKLTICDCDHMMREGHLDANGLWHEGKAAAGEVDMPLYGGVITGSSSQLQLVSSYGEFYLESGNIAGNTIANNKAAILRTQNQGKVVVNGGTCVGNLASIMKIDSDSSGKTEAGCGEINGGKITKNRAPAAIVSNYGTLTVTGGEITDNQSDSGAGAIQNIKNQNIKNATLQLSGQPTIKDNTSKDGHNNIFLENKPIEITGLLQSSAPIGIGMANPGTFTNGWQTQMSGQAPSKYFFADQTGYWVSEENGEAVLTNQKPEVKAPVITKQPEGLNLKYGEGGTLSVEASAEADATVSYQWYQATDATSTENGTVIDGATNATLTIARDAQSGTNYYYCVVTASRDEESKTATSSIATVTVQKPEVKAPVITKQPEGLNLKYGEGGTLSVEASAEADATVSYQWYQATDATSTENGTVIDGATSATLTIAKDAQPGTSYYYCVVTASRDGVSKTATSNTATVTVQKPEVKAPVITKQPERLNLKYGEGGTLSVEASAEADATVSYQWYQAKDGTSIENGTVIDGATSATLTIAKDAQLGTSYYYCVVTAGRDGVDAKTASRIVAVTVKKDEEKPVNPPASPNRPSTQKPGELVINPDGSVTTMVTKPNGTVVVTTKYPNGDRLVLTTETSGMISVLLEGDESRLIILPIKSPQAETVAMVTDASGVTRLEPFAVPTQQGLALKVHNGDAIEIIQKHTVFSDVTATHWAYEPVTFAAARGLLVGIEATHFAPNMQTSRAMIWSILARMDNACLEESTPWYASSQHWAVSGGISDGTDPNATITREQLAAMLYRYAGSPAVRGNVESFSDAQQVSAWAEDALIWAVHEGIIAGTTTDTLTPQGTATRAQTAAMLERFIAWQLGVK
ncbi:MAG: S-layer homology domain-containing protein [Peptococcaceae bacterium]|nr:S-layer homology domain-containing protein [Peptococcaceae bacterium]